MNGVFLAAIFDQELTLVPAIGLLGVSGVVIAYFGTKLTRVADRLADQTGLGEAFMGGVGLGAVTSLPGITVSCVAAMDGRAELALSNAIGGIAAQTAFLAIADIAYRKANLEHAAASVPNMMQATVLILLLGLMLVGTFGPNVTLLGIHPVTPLLLAAYLLAMRMVYRSKDRPMWRPHMTAQTSLDVAKEKRRGLSQQGALWRSFLIAAAMVIVAGWLVTEAAVAIADRTGMNQSIVGGVFTAITTSLPELITSIAAVRSGALTLAVGGVVGGNCFDTLFAAIADVAYREGSIYHAVTGRESMLIATTILMTAILLLGLLRRQRHGPGGIGFESVLILASYLLMIVLLALK